MTEREWVVEARRRVNATAVGVRSTLPELSKQVEQVRSDGRYSDEGKSEEVARVLAGGEAAIREALEEARESLGTDLARVYARVSAVREASPELLEAATRRLAPFLQRSFEDQQGFLNLYRAHFEEPGARRVLEDHAELLAPYVDGVPLGGISVGEQVFGEQWSDLLGQASPDDAAEALAPFLGGAGGGGGGAVSGAASFGEQWRAIQKELAPLRPPEEQEALAERAQLEELERVYLGGVQALVNDQLEGLREGGGDRLPEGGTVRHATLVAAINRYEKDHGLKLSLPGAEAAA